MMYYNNKETGWEEALRQAKGTLGLHLWGSEQDEEEIPQTTPITNLALNSEEIPALIEVFMPPIRERINQKFVKKTSPYPLGLQRRQRKAAVI